MQAAGDQHQRRRVAGAGDGLQGLADIGRGRRRHAHGRRGRGQRLRIMAGVAGHRHGVNRAGHAGERLQEAFGILVGQHAGHQQQALARLQQRAQAFGQGAAGGGVVAAIHPQAAAGGQQFGQRPGIQPLQPRRPFGPAHAGAIGGILQGQGRLRAQHGHGQRGIVMLVGTGQTRQRQRQLAGFIAVMQLVFIYRRIPILATD